MTLPLVSVIIPTYNGAKRIAKTLQSIIAQDYENIEIIVVNDASIDNTVEVCEEVLKNSGRSFKIITHEKNCGVSAARNNGIDAANGKYICFCDSDDLVEKNFVSSLCREAEEKNADLVFCGYKSYYENENKFEVDSIFPEKHIQYPNDYFRAWAKRKIALSCIWNCIFNKNFLKKNNLRFCERLHLYEDGEFILKSIAFSSCISFIDKVLYIYIRHSEHSTAKYRSDEVKMAQYHSLAMWRAGRCILRHTKDSFVRNHVFHVLIINVFIRQLTIAAENGDREYYELKLKNLKHKKMRKIIFSSIKYFFTDPELFFKALMLLYCPNFYYKMRLKK